MTKSELIELISRKQSHLAAKDIELAVKMILERMSTALSTGRRIEIRGFGSFVVKHRQARDGRNPKTGAIVPVRAKRIPFFKVGKELRLRVDGKPYTPADADAL